LFICFFINIIFCWIGICIILFLWWTLSFIKIFIVIIVWFFLLWSPLSWCIHLFYLLGLSSKALFHLLYFHCLCSKCFCLRSWWLWFFLCLESSTYHFRRDICLSYRIVEHRFRIRLCYSTCLQFSSCLCESLRKLNFWLYFNLHLHRILIDLLAFQLLHFSWSWFAASKVLSPVLQAILYTRLRCTWWLDTSTKLSESHWRRTFRIITWYRIPTKWMI